MSRSSKTLAQANFRIGRRQAISLVILLLLLYAVIPQIGKFRASFTVVEHAQATWLVLALCLAILTSFAACGVYVLLAKKRLRYSKMLAVQFASLFASKLLPAGLGALSLNFEYLRRQKHSRTEAGAVVATNNLMGFIGNMILLGGAVLTTSLSLSQLAHPHIANAIYWWVAAIIVVAVILLAWFRKLREELYRTALGMLRDIFGYRNRPLRLLAALACSIALTSLYTLCLLSCAQAAGIQLSFGQALVVLSIGVAGSTVVPTPGGLGGAEAGLFAGLVAYKVASAEALAIVLIYRFITYWLALGFGTLSWIYIRHRNYI